MTGKIVKTYDYRDESGVLLYQNCRYEPKTFRQRRPDSKGWSWNLNGTRRVLYQLKGLLRARKTPWVFYCEGEKDTDNVRALGLVATTAGSASSWKPEFAEFLNDRKVCILAHNDKAGKDLAAKVEKDCKRAGSPEVKILNLSDLSVGGDVSDWLDNGGTKTGLLELADKPERQIRHCKLSTIEPKESEYTIPEVLPKGMLTMLISQEGAGKSTFAAYLTTIISTGAEWPNAPGIPRPAGDVILFSHEECPERVIVPRLIANGADLDRVHLAKGVVTSDGDEYEFDIERSIRQLDLMVDELPDVQLGIFDPITSYVNCNENSNADVRKALKHIVDFAARQNISVLGLSHFNKKIDAGMINRTIGSRAWSAVPRMIWGIRAEQIEDDEGRKTDTENRFLLNIKCNIGAKPKGIKFSISDGGVVICTGERTSLSMDDMGDVSIKRLDEAIEWLSDRLEGSKSVTADTIYRESKEKGFSKSTVDRAKDKLRIRPTRSGYGPDGQWWWSLPE